MRSTIDELNEELRDLERELAAANERIRRLEEAGDLCDASFGRGCPGQHSRYGDCWEAVRAALGRPNPYPEKSKPCQHCLRVECECSDFDVMPDMGDK